MPYIYEGSAATLVPYLQVALTTELSVPPIFFSPNVLGALSYVLDCIDSQGPAEAVVVGPLDDFQEAFNAHFAGGENDFFLTPFDAGEDFCTVSVNYATKTIIVTNEDAGSYPEGQDPYAILLTLP
jgi:hypothetical protein